MSRHIVIVDTETTGLGNEDRIVQLAIVVVHHESLDIIDQSVDLCNNGTPIKDAAMKIHKITNQDIENKPFIKQTKTYQLLEEYNKPENVFVMHNAFFDLYMLAKEMFLIHAQLLDTLTCSRYIYPKLKNHKLQSLIQYSEQYKNVVQEHDALSDCILCLALLKQLAKSYDIDKLVQFTKEPVMGFGKHKGEKMSLIGKNHSDYVDWLMKNFDNMDAPTRIVLKTVTYPRQLDNTETKGLRYIGMYHLLK